MDGFLDYGRPKADLFAGDFYAEQDEVSRGACLDTFFPSDLKPAKGAPSLSLDSGFAPLEIKRPPSALHRVVTFPGAAGSTELPVGAPSGRHYTSAASPSALLHALVSFFTSERDAVLEYKPAKCAVKASVNAQHALLQVRVAFSLLDSGLVAMEWTRKHGDSPAFIHTAQAASAFVEGATGSQVQLAQKLASPGLGAPLGAPLGCPLGLAPPAFGLGCGALLDVPPCLEEDVEPVMAMAADPEGQQEGAVNLAKMLDSPDAGVVAAVLSSRWELVEAMLLAPACVLAAPALVEKLFDQVDVPQPAAARLADACAARLGAEETTLGRRQLARLLFRMLTFGVDVDPEPLVAKLEALADALQKGDQDAPTQNHLSEAALQLYQRRQAVA